MADAMIEKRERKRIFTLERQDETLRLLTNYLKQNRHIDSDEFLYENDKPIAIDPQDFHFLFENIMDAARALNKVGIEEDNDFPNKLSFLSFEGEKLIFFMMQGQGMCTQVYISSDDWQAQHEMTYEQVKTFQAQTEVQEAHS